jgi:N6-adenosine-specific RNA methylase IME4
MTTLLPATPLPTQPALAEHAAEIRRLGTRVFGDLLEIGRRLTECKRIAGHGNWLPWLEREFGWSADTAENYLLVYKVFGSDSESLRNLNLPMQSLRLLAAHSTSEEARTEVLHRVTAGERVGLATVREIVAAGGASAVLAVGRELRAKQAEENRAERIERLAEISRANVPLPGNLQFPILLADPPWDFESYGSQAQPRCPKYPTMSIAELCAMPVDNLATDPALLLMWVVSSHLENAFQIIKAWNFQYVTNACWVKTECAFGNGYFVRHQHELLIICRRGAFPTPSTAARPSSVIIAPRGDHSEKPAALYEIVERMYPTLPKIELFARGPARPGWHVWGNQAETAE